MDLKQYLTDIDKVYVYNNGEITEFDTIDSLSSDSLIINDNSIDKGNSYNRNISVLNKILFNKSSKNTVYNGTDIECDAPSGYILVTDGPGQEPYWTDPVLFKESMQIDESIDTERISLNYNTLSSSLFSTLYGATVSSVINITDDSSNIILNSMDIPDTVSYKFKMRITPITAEVLSYGTDHIIISGTNLDNNYKVLVITESGLTELSIDNIEYIDGNSKITANNLFGNVYKCFIFKMYLSADVYTDTVSYKKQYIEDILLIENDLYVNYTLKECNGSKIKFQLNCNSGIVIQYIDIELITL